MDERVWLQAANRRLARSPDPSCPPASWRCRRRSRFSSRASINSCTRAAAVVKPTDPSGRPPDPAPVRCGSCRCQSRQRHIAGCPAFEVRILYPFHPRAEQVVQVMHRKRFAGEDHLVVVQPDGTLALIPSWMSETTARFAALTTLPRLCVERLVELRARIDALLASPSGASSPRCQFASNSDPPFASKNDPLSAC